MINTERLEEADVGRWVQGSYRDGDTEHNVRGLLHSWFKTFVLINVGDKVISAYASDCYLESNGSGDLSTDERNPEITYSEINDDDTLTVYAMDQRSVLVARTYQPLGKWTDHGFGEVSPQEGELDD